MAKKTGPKDRLFDPIPQCVDCLTGLARKTAAMADSNNPGLPDQCAAIAEALFPGWVGSSLTSPQMARRILAEVKQLSGVADPFADFKVQEMARANEMFSRLEKYVGTDLRSRLCLAALGNSLDFFRDAGLALAELPGRIERGVSFVRDHTDRLSACLSKRPGLILYFTDNAGEVYFDLPLYEYIRERTEKAVVVVKGGPALNDLTRVELSRTNLEGKFDMIMDTGSDAPGIDWDLAPKALIDLVRSADLIISKGMANFETIAPHPLPTPVFHICEVKCGPIKRYLDMPEGSLMAVWQDKDSLPEET